MTCLAISSSVLNKMAWRAQHRPWRRLFSMSDEEQRSEVARLSEAIRNQGCSEVVAERYLHMAPLEDELQAFADYVSEHPDWYWARNEVSGLDLSLVDIGTRDLMQRDAAQLKALLALEPERLCPPAPADQQRRAWHDEASSMWELTAGDLAASLLEPWPMAVYEDFEPEPPVHTPLDHLAVDEWFRWAIADPYRMLALEQCWTQDRASTASERAAALAMAPCDLRAEIGAFWCADPDSARLAAAWLVRGMVRAERTRRCRVADWSPLYPMSPWWRAQDPLAMLEPVRPPESTGVSQALDEWD